MSFRHTIGNMLYKLCIHCNTFIFGKIRIHFNVLLIIFWYFSKFETVIFFEDFTSYVKVFNFVYKTNVYTSFNSLVIYDKYVSHNSKLFS